MTGEQLLTQLQQLTPEQRKFAVVIPGEDKFRDLVYMDTGKEIKLAYIDDEGEENEDEEPNCICLEEF